MDDNKSTSGFFHGAKDISASGNTFNNVGGDFNHHVINNFTANHLVKPLKLYPAGKLSRVFTGHESHLRALDDYFFDAGDVSIRKSFLLHGKKGVGKTQICLKFVQDAQDKFSNVLWIDASNEGSILSSLRVIAEALQLSSTSSPLHILSRISTLGGHWLLVFDNAEIGYNLLGTFYPPGNRGSILITSRTNDFERLIGHHSFSVREMEEGDAISLLLKSGNLGSSFKSIARRIVSKLGFMPDLIDQAGYYIHHHKCDPETLLVLDMAKGDVQPDASEEFIMVLMKSKEESLEGKDTLDGVDTSVLLVWHDLAYSFYTQEKWSEAETWGLKAMEGRKKILGFDHLQTLRSMAVVAFTYGGQGKYEKAKDLWLQVAEGREAKLGKENQDTLVAYHQIAYLSYIQSKWADAETWGLKAVEGRKKVVGINHSSTLISMQNLGQAYHKQHKYKEETELRLHVVEVEKATLGEDHPDTLSTMHNLTCALYCQEKWTEAETWGLKTVEGRKKLLGTKDLLTLGSMDNLASIYDKLHKWERLTEVRLEIVEGKIALLGENDPETLLAMNDTAVAYYHHENWIEAERWGLKAVEGRKKVLGVTHLHTLLSMLNLADMHTLLNKWDEAADLYMRVIEGRTARLGTHHEDTLEAMRKYGVMVNRKQDRK